MNMLSLSPELNRLAYHTKFPELVDAIVETMEEHIQANSSWCIRSSTAKAMAAERSRSINMIAIINILKKNLRNEEPPLHPNERQFLWMLAAYQKDLPLSPENQALLLLSFVVINHMGDKVRELALPKFIELSEYKVIRTLAKRFKHWPDIFYPNLPSGIKSIEMTPD